MVLAEGRVRASQHGSDVVIETDFGLRVAYDLAYNVRVTIPGNYYQQLCGLCGNYNGDPKDDFQKPDGSQAGSSNEFGSSWQEAVPGSPCLPTCKPGESCDTELECKPELQEKYEQQQFCGLLTSPTGPLAACHKLVDPQGPLKDCVFDRSKTSPDNPLLWGLDRRREKAWPPRFPTPLARPPLGPSPQQTWQSS